MEVNKTLVGTSNSAGLVRSYDEAKFREPAIYKQLCSYVAIF